jgi:hypothetical protein
MRPHTASGTLPSCANGTPAELAGFCRCWVGGHLIGRFWVTAEDVHRARPARHVILPLRPVKDLLPALAIVVSAGTALLIAYWHRKQIRQIEEYRRKPAVGLIAPPSPVWAFVKGNRAVLLGYGFPAVWLGYQLWLTSPVTRWTVLSMAASVGLLVFTFMAHLIVTVVRTMASTIGSAVTTISTAVSSALPDKNTPRL